MRVDLFRRALVVAAVALVGKGAALASETIDVTIDFAKVLQLNEPARTIFIGNPGIADASMGDEKTLVLTGKTAGATNLIVLGKSGEEIINAEIRVASDVRQLTTIFYGTSRQTFSCAPVCEAVVSVGDAEATFTRAATQIAGREEFSNGQ